MSSSIEPRSGVTVASDEAWDFRIDSHEVLRPAFEGDVRSELESWAWLTIDAWRRRQDFACPNCADILVEDSTIQLITRMKRIKCRNLGCQLEWPGIELLPVG
jgi:hypothetical protein